MNAEQYRALVAKLEAINPSVVNEKADPTRPASMKNINGMNIYTNDPEPNVAEPAAATPAAEPAAAPAVAAPAASAPATDPNQIPTIEAATFSQAYAQAKKQGLKKFKWCGVYAVKDKPQPVRPQPAKTSAGKVDYLGQQDPLGGDKENPMSFAPNSNFGA